MKKDSLLILLFVVLNCISITIKAQVQLPPVLQNPDRSAGISCDSNTFWAIVDDSIVQFQIRGDSAISVGVFNVPFGNYSLAFCNNLNGAPYSPTFYTSANQTLLFYNNGNWDTAQGNTNYDLPNAAGYGDYLYFIGGTVGSQIVAIQRYIDSTFTPIYQQNDSAGVFAVPAIAADDSGNVWFVGGNFNSMTYIEVISPSGQILKQFNIPHISNNSTYGCFLLNNIFYVALGFGNTFNPNTLIPFSFSLDSAIMGTPVKMPENLFQDLASCNPGAPLSQKPAGISKLSTGQSGFNIYPDPAIDRVVIDIEESLIGRSAEVIDMRGRTVSVIVLKNQRSSLDVSDFSSGIYFITITATTGENTTKKLIISK